MAKGNGEARQLPMMLCKPIDERVNPETPPPRQGSARRLKGLVSHRGRWHGNQSSEVVCQDSLIYAYAHILTHARTPRAGIDRGLIGVSLSINQRSSVGTFCVSQ